MPADVVASNDTSPFAGAWVGSWDGRLNTVLVVESVDAAGSAKVVYAVAGSPGRFAANWARRDAEIRGDTMTVTGAGAAIRFTHSGSGRLRAVFGQGGGFAVLSRSSLQELRNPAASLPWLAGQSVRLDTALVENGQAVMLEAVIYRPPGNGPFPLAVVNHGSTGRGTEPALARQTWSNPWLADLLNQRGWIVAFPQRRGRGKSDGLYDEGFSRDRSKGYTCEVKRSLAGAQRALDDLDAAITALRARPDVSEAPMLIAGDSRGGVLSVAYAGLHPQVVTGAVNFVGGWVAEGCRSAATINQSLFGRGTGFGGPTLWVYGQDDPYYAIAHSRENFQVFAAGGGQGEFVEVSVPGSGNGHWAMAVPTLWMPALTGWLDRLPGADGAPVKR
ncbi:MAG: alpha/beta hydrolase [Burkholderiaceae bacterium]